MPADPNAHFQFEIEPLARAECRRESIRRLALAVRPAHASRRSAARRRRVRDSRSAPICSSASADCRGETIARPWSRDECRRRDRCSRRSLPVVQACTRLRDAAAPAAASRLSQAACSSPRATLFARRVGGPKSHSASSPCRPHMPSAPRRRAASLRPARADRECRRRSPRRNGGSPSARRDRRRRAGSGSGSSDVCSRSRPSFRDRAHAWRRCAA